MLFILLLYYILAGDIALNYIDLTALFTSYFAGEHLTLKHCSAKDYTSGSQACKQSSV